MADFELPRPDLVILSSEDRQQLEAGELALNGMRAASTIARQVLSE